MVFLLVLAAGFWLFQLLRSVCNLFSYWDIQVFYREALHIPPVSMLYRTGQSGAMEGPTEKSRETEAALGLE